MSAPIDLYYWPTPNGWKISILLEELKQPYNVHYVNIGKGEQFEPDFLAIAPNNRMPAIVDPEGPDGKPVSIFESAAIMMYLARKHGKFGGSTEREQIEIQQWLMWQMGGLGPMAGQAHHFLNYAPERIPYGMDRYRNEVNRLYGVLNKRLADRDYVAGDYSIADMAIWPWAILWKNQEQDITQFPHMEAWIKRVGAREAVVSGKAVGEDHRKNIADDEEAKKVLFGQKAR